MTQGKYFIRFGPCPIEKHKGETWEKLQDRDLSKPAFLEDIAYIWSSDMSIPDIRNDTFQDFEMTDWEDLMAVYNKGEKKVFGMLLYLTHPDGDFTTFRTYKVSSARHYENMKDRREPLMLKVRKVA